MEQIKEFLFAETMSVFAYAVGLFFVLTVAFYLLFKSGRKYRKSQEEVFDLRVVLAEKDNILNAYRREVPSIIEKREELRKEVRQDIESLKEQNSFYEARIKHLTDQLKERTCQNRETALMFAMKQGLDADATVRTAKLYPRFLQGKE